MSGKTTATLSGIEWAQLLCKHPELADECDWTAFDGDAWHCLLCKRPEFAGRCDWSFTKEWDAKQGPGSCGPGQWYWVTLLSKQPQFADKCKVMDEFDAIDRHWTKTDESDFGDFDEDDEDGRRGKVQALFLKVKPESSSSIGVEDFTAEDWIAFLQTADAVPQTILDKCPVESFEHRDWASLLKALDSVPTALLDKSPWEEFNGEIWSGILSSKNKERFLEHCPWKRFGEEDWRYVLYFHPECRVEFDAHAGLTFEDLHMEDWEPSWW